MSNFSDNLKKYRKLAGLTQLEAAEKIGVSVTAIQNWEKGINIPRNEKISKLAYIYNISEKVLVESLIGKATTNKVDNWPYFLFDDEENKIVQSLCLNLAQQELFGLLYIYGSEILDNTFADSEPLDIDLKKIPYEFIARIGSINVLNVAEGLKHVLNYVKTDFLLEQLRKNPEEEFDICRLDKTSICDYINHGLKEFELDDFSMDKLEFNIDLKEVGNVLKAFDECGEKIYWTDDDDDNPHRDDVPENLKKYKTLRSFPLWYGQHYTIHKVKAEDGHDKIYICLEDCGRKLLRWFKE